MTAAQAAVELRAWGCAHPFTPADILAQAEHMAPPCPDFERWFESDGREYKATFTVLALPRGVTVEILSLFHRDNSLPGDAPSMLIAEKFFPNGRFTRMENNAELMGVNSQKFAASQCAR